MPQKTLYSVIMIAVLVILLATQAWAWGVAHVGYTGYGPNGVYHYGATAVGGPYGAYHGDYAYGAYHPSYGYAGYYAPVPAPYCGGYHYAAPYAGYTAGVYRAW